MDWLNPAVSFRRDGPFFPLVLAYLCELHGFIELASRGLALRFADRSSNEREDFAASVDAPNVEGARAALAGGVTGLIGRQELASVTSSALRVDVAKLASGVLGEGIAAVEKFNDLSAGALLILAWDTTDPDHTHEPDWEFLRHLRNAAAHGGAFNLRAGEPRHPAHWRGLAVTRAIHGMRLFAAPVGSGFIGIGDVLYLLADIEHTHLREPPPN